ncbi:ABC transporter permease [Jiangella alba]|uniref:Putative spermidine/putrescine transport system permease protein n=1 Tax=Jiangella alba TaxID=561176 RepID=A0A1H5PXZ9_9ACTN|nr:ABC transporter permease [Jiangella alba]SEF18743.1 putative spermidine/putrescine transport system permease protein [Jiangella alba]
MSSQYELRSSLAQGLGRLRWAIHAVAVIVLVFLLIPLLIVFPISITRDHVLTWPPDLASWQWFDAFFTSPVWVDSLLASLRIAVPAAVIATVVGTLGALGLAYARRWRRVLQTLFIAPLVLPIVTYALGLYDVAQRFDATGSLLPVIVGQAMLSAPMVFVTVGAALANRDHQLPLAASSLGASARKVLTLVELPLLKPAVAAGGLIALAMSFDEIVVAYFLLPPGAGTLPVVILGSTRESADPTIAAASMVVIAMAVTVAALLVLVNVLMKRKPS